LEFGIPATPINEGLQNLIIMIIVIIIIIIIITIVIISMTPVNLGVQNTAAPVRLGVQNFCGTS